VIEPFIVHFKKKTTFINDIKQFPDFSFRELLFIGHNPIKTKIIDIDRIDRVNTPITTFLGYAKLSQLLQQTIEFGDIYRSIIAGTGLALIRPKQLCQFFGTNSPLPTHSIDNKNQ